MSCVERAAMRGTFALLALMASCHSEDPVPPPAADLRFGIAPSLEVAAGVAFNVTVQLLDSNGTAYARGRDPVNIIVSPSGSIIGNTGVRAVNGVARFDGIRLTKVDSNLVMTASIDSKSVASEPFRVVPGPVSAQQSATSLTALSIVQDEPTRITLTLRDGPGNVIARQRVMFSSPVPGVTFVPDTGTTAPDGTIATVMTSTVPGGIGINATVGATTTSLLSGLNVCPLAPLAVPGNVSGSVTANTCVSGNRATAPYKFTLPAAGGVSLGITSTFSPRLEVRTHPTTFNEIVAPQQNVPVEWLLPAGTYQARVSTPTGGGAFTLTGANVPANTGCVTRHIVAPGTYTGQRLSAGDCTFSEDGSYYDRYFIHTDGPCGIIITNPQFTAYIFVYDAVTGEVQALIGGSDVGETQNTGFGKCSSFGHPLEFRINALPDEAGPYTMQFVILPPTANATSPATARAIAAQIGVDSLTNLSFHREVRTVADFKAAFRRQ